MRGNKNAKQLTLTFDDGPSFTSKKIIKILDKYSCKATFFWLGSNLSNHIDALNQAIENGHVIGNHSWDHTNLGNYEAERFWIEQIDRTNKEFERLTGDKMIYYRPPFGNVSNDQITFLKEKNIKTVLWTVSTIDWDERQNSCNQITNRVMGNLNPGTIILLHDFDSVDNPDAGSNRRGMLLALKRIIKKCKALGYEFVTIETLINSK
ncbi:polysaccharide deacetylase family protein [Seonamhaeicola sp. MEBiC1930]|uniref:polysaccharide deacetylase family protein n=1 Tax=Seonamhaeicola sp. MEBiC01930 TaxID=2976768 RepID=UPI00325499AB